MLCPGALLLRGRGILGLVLAATLAACGSPQEPPAAPAVPDGQPSDGDPEPEADSSATLDVIAGQPTEILLDGKPIGATPISRRKVAPGSHEVTFVDATRGNRTMVVTVEAGEAKTVQSDTPPSVVKLGGQDKNEQ